MGTSCKYFGTCGGCDTLDQTPRSQRAHKLEQLKELLNSQIQAGTSVQLYGADRLKKLNYRSRISVSLAKEGDFTACGLNQKVLRSKVVDIEHCPLLTPELNSALSSLRIYAKELYPYVHHVELHHIQEETYALLHLYPQPKTTQPFQIELQKKLSEEFAHCFVFLRHKPIRYFQHGVSLPLPAYSPSWTFRQVNESGNKILQELVLKYCISTTCTDLFAGSGNFSIPLAQQGIEVHAVEIDHYAEALAEAQIKEYALQDLITYHRMPAEKFCSTHALSSTVLVDPPRSGCKRVLEAADLSRTNRIIYISCQPNSFVQDLEVLEHRNFELKKCFFIDMFPNTRHMEIVNVFDKT